MAISKEYRKFLASKEWEAIRQAYLRQVEFMCEICNETKNIQVHHLNYDNLYNPTPEDLMAVCQSCHNVLEQDLECFPKEIKVKKR
jgi:5-methylcytosine-specific restriction endonuclease McrA